MSEEVSGPGYPPVFPAGFAMLKLHSPVRCWWLEGKFCLKNATPKGCSVCPLALPCPQGKVPDPVGFWLLKEQRFDSKTPLLNIIA